MSKKNNNLVTVLLTNNRQILKVALSLLDDAGIKYYLKVEENKNSENPITNKKLIDTLADQIELQVSHENSIKSKSLIADLQELDFDEKEK